jgi:uncharacterized membrane protein YhaH (DUF805 family)
MLSNFFVVSEFFGTELWGMIFFVLVLAPFFVVGSENSRLKANRKRYLIWLVSWYLFNAALLVVAGINSMLPSWARLALAFAIIFGQVLYIFFAKVIVRRTRDAGMPKIWAYASVVPILGFIPSVCIALPRSDPDGALPVVDKMASNSTSKNDGEKRTSDSSENVVDRDGDTEVAPSAFSRIPRLPRLLTLIWGVLSLISIIGIYALDIHDREHISSSRMQKAFVAVISISFGTFFVLYLSNLGHLMYVKKGRPIYARKVAAICTIWPIAVSTFYLAFGEDFLYDIVNDDDFSLFGWIFYPVVGFLISATLWGLASRKTANHDEIPKRNN